MEVAPTVTPFEKPSVIKLKDKIMLTYENNKYSLLIYIMDEKIVMEIKSLNSSKFYKEVFPKDLISQNKYFLMFDNIEQIYNEIVKLIKKSLENQNNIIKIKEESTFLMLTIPLPTEVIKEANFKINISYNSPVLNINDVYESINELKNEIQELKSFFTNEIKKLQNNPINNNITDENIRKNELELINKWIDSKKKLNFNLLFKKTKNGNSVEDFHKFCDEKGKTVIIIETIEGIKFGAFMNESWNSQEEWKKNYKDFVFQLNLNKKFHTSEGHTMFCHANLIIIGDGNGEISFENTLIAGTCNDDNFNTEGILNFGKKYFITKEIEVYQVVE